MIRTLKLSVIALIICLSSCNKDNDNPNVTFKATLSGANEKPTPNASTATGTAILIFNNDTKIFTINVSYTGITGGYGFCCPYS